MDPKWIYNLTVLNLSLGAIILIALSIYNLSFMVVKLNFNGFQSLKLFGKKKINNIPVANLIDNRLPSFTYCAKKVNMYERD